MDFSEVVATVEPERYTSDMDMRTDARTLYAADEQAWLYEQAAAVAAGHFDDVDRNNLSEFLIDVARREEREVRSRMIVLLVHLLKTRFQPALVSKSWLNTVREQQDRVNDIVERSATLMAYARADLAVAYARAPRAASVETDLDVSAFPETCPWELADVLATGVLADLAEKAHTGGS